MQETKLRQLILQSKQINYRFLVLSQPKEISGKLSLETPRMRLVFTRGVQIEVGDTVEVSGKVEDRVINSTTQKMNLSVHTFHVITKSSASAFYPFFQALSRLEKIPQVVFTRLLDYIEPPQAALLSGIVFGGNSGMPYQLIQDTKNTGLIHITSASGFNVTLFVVFSLSVFSRLFNLRIAAIMSLGAVFAYSLVSGLTPPIARAVMMSVLYIMAIVTGRKYSARLSLCLVGIIMLIQKPFLIYSISFQLSFLATAGVLYADVFFPGFLASGQHRRTLGGKIWGVLEENFKQTVAVLIWTAPVLIYHFGIFSLVAPLANACLLWMIGPLMYLGVLLSVTVFVSPFISLVLSVPISILLQVFMRSVHLFSLVPWATLPIVNLDWSGLLVYEFTLVAWVTWKLAKGRGE